MMTYTVQAGDSLSIIALDFYGDSSVWPQIAQLNNIVPPYDIYPGQQLDLPDVPASTTPAPPTPGIIPTKPPVLRPATAAPSSGWMTSPWTWLIVGAAAFFIFYKTRGK